ncbi:MAG: hypothetical protein ACRD0J_03140, partial [Acidimicrobiales bacterium]
MRTTHRARRLLRAGVALTSAIGLGMAGVTVLGLSGPPLGGTAYGATGSVTVVAAGDIACDPGDKTVNPADPPDPYLSGHPSFCQAPATAAEVKGMSPSYILPLGDIQYR